MDIEHTLLRFFGFIGIELGFVIVAALAAIPLGILILSSDSIKNWYLSLTGVIFEALGATFLFLCIWVLTGAAYGQLLGILLLFAISAILFSELVWLIVGSPRIAYAGRMLYLQHEFKKLWPRLEKAIQIGGIVPFILYTIYIGVGYFGDSKTGYAWTKFVFEATILALIGGAWLVNLPRQLYTMLSENMLGPTRTRILINQMAFAAPITLYISLFLWATTDIGDQTTPMGSFLQVSPALSISIVTYVVVFIVLPFVIGHYRSKDKVSTLQDSRNKRIEEFLSAVGSPGIHQVDRKLADLGDALAADLEQIEADPSMQVARELIDGDEQSLELKLPRLALQSSSDRDPRFLHQQAVAELTDRLNELIEAMEDSETDDGKRAAIDIVVPELEKVLDRQYGGESTASTWAIGLASSAGTAILTPIWTTVTSYLTGIIGIEG